MTEVEWLAGADPMAMLTFLRGGASDRKLRLVACACFRHHRGRFPAESDGREWPALAAAERHADGLLTRDQLKLARRRARGVYGGALCGPAWDGARVVVIGTVSDVYRLSAGTHPPNIIQLVAEVRAVYRGLIQEVFGNPFRPVSFDPRWQTTPVFDLAQGMYESRDFAPMPILADALEEAGCDNADILAHCRGGGPHVRGCWVVDLVLGKS